MSTFNRTLILVISNTNTKLMADISLILSTYDINKIINKCNSQLKQFLPFGLVPCVKIKKDILDLAKNNETKLIDFEELRLLIHDFNGNIQINGINEEKNSHTIEVYAATNEQDIPLPPCQYNLRVVVDSIQQVMAIIEDVIMDIQMFHFYNLESMFITTEDKKEFSKKKMDFCKDKKSYNYLINSGNYCSIASYCRNDNLQLDYELYCKLWDKFYKQLTSMSYDGTDIQSVEELVKYIISNHEQGNQISPKKLRKLIKKECVEAGKYTLVRWTKRPKTRKELNKIRVLLKGRWIHTGKIIIVPGNKRFCYQTNEKYFSLFDFYFSKNWI